jgi:hypothetical protein
VQHRRLAILVLAIATTLFSTLSFAQSCPTGEVMCGTVCSNINTDPKHCGNCATACTPGDVCTSGSKGGAPECLCPAPKVMCAASVGEVCVNTATNAKHCGTCGTACATGHVCISGRCTLPP